MSDNDFSDLDSLGILDRLDNSSAPGLVPTPVPTASPSPAPLTVPDDIDNVARPVFEADPQQLKQSLYVADEADPDRAAKVIKLAGEMNLPRFVVEQNYDKLEAVRQRKGSNDIDQLVTESPGLARFLSNPDNAAISKDDTASLSQLDNGISFVTREEGQGPRFKLLRTPFGSFPILWTDTHEEFKRAGQTGLHRLHSSTAALSGAYGWQDPESAATSYVAAKKATKELQDQLPDYSKDFNKIMEEHGGNLRKSIDVFSSGFERLKERKILEALALFDKGRVNSTWNVMQMIASASVRPRGLMYSVAENLSNAIPSMLAGGAGAAVTGPGAGVGFVLGSFTGELATEVGSEIDQALESRGIDTTDVKAVQAAFSNPVLMADIRSAAQRKGLATASVDALFNAFAGRVSVFKGAKYGTKVANKIADTGIQMLGESVSEGAGQLAREIPKTTEELQREFGPGGENKSLVSRLDPGGTVLEGLTSLGQSAAETVIMTPVKKLSGNPAEVAQSTVKNAEKALQAAGDAEVLNDIGRVVQESKTAKRIPEKIGELVNASANKPASVFFQATEWDDFWTSRGQSPAKAAENIMADGGKAYMEAKSLGIELEIPLWTYIEKVAATEDFSGLNEIIVTREGGKNLKESVGILQDLPAQMKQLAKEAAEMAAAEAVKSQSAKAVGEDVYQRLRSIGINDKEARAHADVFESKYGTRAQIMETTPQALFKTKFEKADQVTDADGQVLNQDGTAPAFYSKMERTISEKMGNSATPEQIKGLLRETKEAERKAFGIDEFLEGKEKVTKEELLNHIRANSLEVKEVTLSDGEQGLSIESERAIRELQARQAELDAQFKELTKDYPTMGDESRMPEDLRAQVSAAQDEYQKILERIELIEEGGNPFEHVVAQAIREWRAAAKVAGIDENQVSQLDIMAGGYPIAKLPESLKEPARKLSDARMQRDNWEKPSEQEDTKYSKYTLPGGENYREVLFTLPVLPGQSRPDVPQGKVEKNEKFDTWTIVWDKGGREGGFASQELAELELKHAQRRFMEGSASEFQSSHWDEPNVFAHARLNDRTGPNGEKILFIEEIQSDWDLEGRQKGFKDGPDRTEKEYVITKNGAGHGPSFRTMEEAQKQVEAYQRLQMNKDAKFEISEKTFTIPSGKVPNFPFQKNWHEYTLKRIIRMAAEGGYDQVAWTTGEQQAERYDLSKVVDSITYAKKEDNLYAIAVDGPDDTIYSNQNATIEDIQGVVGKEIAKKIEGGEGKHYRGREAGVKEISGAGLKIGGEGKKVLYDQIIPSFMNKLGKKFGAKVTEVKIDGVVLGTSREDLIAEETNLNELRKFRNRIPDKLSLLDFGNEDGRYDRDDVLTNRIHSDELPVWVEGNAKEGYFASWKQLRKIGEYKTKAELEAKLADDTQQFIEREIVDRQDFIKGLKSGKDAVPVHSLPITPELRKSALEEGFSLFQGGPNDPRGRIILKENESIIQLFKGKNFSTLVHESGHLFLNDLAEDYAILKAKPETERTFAQHQLVKDGETILKWFGLESFDQIKTEHHEKFAVAWEKYAMEGNAPTQALRDAFIRFKVWLLGIYLSVRNLDVDLTPDVRGVFDRMLAVQDEIDLARREQNFEPAFQDPAAFGMTGPKGDRYIKARIDFQKAAIENLEKRVMQDLKREQTAQWKEEREKVRAQVDEQISSQPVYVAMLAMRKGIRPDGTAFESLPPKLSRKMVKAAYGQEMVERLPKDLLVNKVTGEGGVVFKDGVHPDVAAEIYGFESGAALLEALATAPDQTQLIEATTDQEMAERHPELISEPEISDEAMKALHNERRSELLQMELEHLASNDLPVLKDVIRQVTKRPRPIKEVRAQAQSIIGSKTPDEIKPNIFLRAEARAAKEAGEAVAHGDFDAAFDAKQRELLNHELYRAAVEAKDTISSALDGFKKILKKDADLAKTREMDLVNAARALLANFGIGKKSDKAPMDHLAYIKQYDVETYNVVKSLVDTVPGEGHYESRSYDEFLQMRTTVTAIWDLSKSVKENEVDGKKVKLETVVDELAERIATMAPKEKKAYVAAYGEEESKSVWLLGMKAAITRVEHWVDKMDAGVFNGAFRKYIWQPVLDATVEYQVQKVKYLKQITDLLANTYTEKGELTGPKIMAPELGEGAHFQNKSFLVGAILHRGNLSNFQKLLRGYKWGSLDENGVLDTSRWDAFEKRMWAEGKLTKKDYDFAQAVWNLNDSMKSMTQRAHKQMYGHYFNEITEQEFETPWGTYRGGYVPATPDMARNMDAQIRRDQEEVEQNNNTYRFPTTGRGATKARVEAYAAPLDLNLAHLPKHIDWALRFSLIEPRIKEVARIVFDKRFRSALAEVDASIASKMLVPWLQRTARQQVETPGKIEGLDWIARQIRGRTSLQFLAFNLINAVQNFAAMPAVLLKVKARHMRDALWTYTASPKETAEMIVEKSPYMATRVTAVMAEIMGHLDELLLNPNKYEKAQKFWGQHSYILSGMTQNMTEILAWVGAYNQSIESGVSEKQAVKEADSVVRTILGSGAAIDISRMESGTPVDRVFTQFATFFNTQANMLGSEFSKASNLGLREGAGRMLYVYVMGFMLPSFFAEAIARALSGGLDQDDDGEYMDDLMEMFFLGQIRYGTAMIPFAGQAIQSAVNIWNDKAYDDRITVSPAISMLETAIRSPVSVYKAISDKNASHKKAIRDSLTLLGLMTKLPLSAAARPLGYMSDVNQRKIKKPTGPIDYTRGLLTGKGIRKK